MAESVIDRAERQWSGATPGDAFDLRRRSHLLEEVAAEVAFIDGFANVSAFRTGEGLVLVDTGSPMTAPRVHEEVRRWDRSPLHTAVYSHGHIDHVFGVPVFEAEAETEGWARPRVVAHEALPARFDRYVLTAGFNAGVNQRQFSAPNLQWPTEYRYPDETYRDHLTLDVGGERFELHHGRGETDDHTWTWVPGRRVLCPGDFFVWVFPNAGNPQKVQRYPREWALAMRQMADLGAELMLPGHGLPVVGADRIRTALLDYAEVLESLHDQAVALMNAGATLDDLIHTVEVPAGYLDKPYLQPVYDEPEFVVRNVWRLYGGWYDGNPAHLKPARFSALAAEVAALAGGAPVLADRAGALAEAGDLRLAAHLVELAAAAAPGDADVQRRRADVYERRAAAERSLMAKGIFRAAARDSEERSQA